MTRKKTLGRRYLNEKGEQYVARRINEICDGTPYIWNHIATLADLESLIDKKPRCFRSVVVELDGHTFAFDEHDFEKFN